LTDIVKNIEKEITEQKKEFPYKLQQPKPTPKKGKEKVSFEPGKARIVEPSVSQQRIDEYVHNLLEQPSTHGISTLPSFSASVYEEPIYEEPISGPALKEEGIKTQGTQTDLQTAMKNIQELIKRYPEYKEYIISSFIGNSIKNNAFNKNDMEELKKLTYENKPYIRMIYDILKSSPFYKHDITKSNIKLTYADRVPPNTVRVKF